jgi:hypothetical protein
MLLQIVFEDDRFDYIKDTRLNDLIESRKIKKFRRSTGWVTVGVDPIRSSINQSSFDGIERRATNAGLSP